MGKADVIDGKAIAGDIRVEIKQEVAKLKEQTGKVPGLAVVLVGSRKDSETYVRNKRKNCEEVGFESFQTDLPEDVSQEDLLKVVAEHNADDRIHGVLVQLPLPKHISEREVLDAVSLDKDVDGFHPHNIGSLALRGRSPKFVSCTPKGVMELLKRKNVKISGKRAVVIGRSNIVGMPVALLLQAEDATVTVIHSRTSEPEAICKEADILVAAIGRAEFVPGSWIKPGAVVIDVGMNDLPDSTKKRGYRLVGDVNYAEASGC
ncbi:hypothetical protein WJX84_012150 [Apatococcus fuscideae]|uniref:Methenyltetrahydrofolate cyclohydrolase n=1 Tax=Apatococcus fuscideae TaxID=2026836 RepID=A0AAW1SQB8_9CHLO